MRNIKSLALIFLFTLISCGEKRSSSGKTDFSLGYWGQLVELEFFAPSPLYLIHLKPGDTYKVCVADHLTKEHPQILIEIDAAVKIWARYINRNIQTEVYTFKSDAPDAFEHQDTTFQKYQSACPNANVVVGYGNISSVGQAASKYSYYTDSAGVNIVNNANKVVFLQNPIFGGRTWRGFFKQEDPSITSEELINKIMARDQYQYLVEENELSTLVVLMHEFGHVWGLCDMYPLGNGHTNCDPQWSKKDESGEILLTPHATMAASKWRNPLYLHDDDIEGIQTLAARAKYINNWDNQKNFSTPPVKNESPFYFQHKKSTINGNQLAFEMALYNPKPISIQIQMMSDRGPLNYQPIKVEQIIDTPSYTLNLGFPEGLKISKLEMTLKDEQGKTLFVHQEVF